MAERVSVLTTGGDAALFADRHCAETVILADAAGYLVCLVSMLERSAIVEEEGVMCLNHRRFTLRLEDTLIVACGRDNARVSTELFLVLVVLCECKRREQSKKPEGMNWHVEHDCRRW